MSSLKEAEEESRQFAKQWRTEMIRGAVAILVGAFLLLVFSPKGITEHICSILFITPLLLWAYKSPKSRKTRVITSISCYIASMVLYFGWIQNG